MALYDPKEFPTETTVGPDFTLADVLAWARTKPRDEVYPYWDTANCACGQYAKYAGINCDPNSDERLRLERLVGNRFASDSPFTFGAFADRLEAALSA